jgi:hypothetical protein
VVASVENNARKRSEKKIQDPAIIRYMTAVCRGMEDVLVFIDVYLLPLSYQYQKCRE